MLGKTMTTAIKSQPLSSSKVSGRCSSSGQRTKGASDNHYVSDDGHSQGDDAKQIEEMLQHEPNTHSRPLPNEILQLIIHHVKEGYPIRDQHHLYPCTLVNKQFYAIANPLLWREPVVSLDSTCSSSPLFFDTLTTLGHHVRKLRFLSDKHDATATILPPPAFPRYCTQLTCLDLYASHLSEPTTVRAIGQHCLQLREFGLVFDTTTGLWEDIFLALGHCPFTTLRLACLGPPVRVLTDQMEMDLLGFRRLTSLTTLNVGFLGHLLTLANTYTTNSWPHLKKLRLNNSSGIADADFTHFIQTHPHLQSIGLRYGTLSDASLETMARSLPDLREVHLVKVNGISPDGVRRLIRNCPGLVALGLGRCDHILLQDLVPGADEEVHYFDLTKDDLDKIRADAAATQ